MSHKRPRHVQLYWKTFHAHCAHHDFIDRSILMVCIHGLGMSVNCHYYVTVLSPLVKLSFYISVTTHIKSHDLQDTQSYHGYRPALVHLRGWSSCSCRQCSLPSSPPSHSCGEHCRRTASQTRGRKSHITPALIVLHLLSLQWHGWYKQVSVCNRTMSETLHTCSTLSSKSRLSI